MKILAEVCTVLIFHFFLFIILQLLDDNRELFIPETQETVVAHPMFMLFATQNPPGHYGGRKVYHRIVQSVI